MARLPAELGRMFHWSFPKSWGFWVGQNGWFSQKTYVLPSNVFFFAFFWDEMTFVQMVSREIRSGFGYL